MDMWWHWRKKNILLFVSCGALNELLSITHFLQVPSIKHTEELPQN
jgi:hypothetical protein